MDAQIFSEKWDDLKSLIKNEWTDLAHKDIEKIKGQKDQLLRLLQDKYGYTIEMAESKLKTFLEKSTKDLESSSKKVVQMGKDYADAMQDTMKKNVLQTALMAFGIGIIADRLIHRLFSSR